MLKEWKVPFITFNYIKKDLVIIFISHYHDILVPFDDNSKIWLYKFKIQKTKVEK